MSDAATSNQERAFDVRGSVELAASVLAPITIITALLAYVGWIRSQAYFGFFGINQGVLGLSVQDYLIRSADVTFGAVARLFAVVLAVVLLDRLLLAGIERRIGGGEDRRRWMQTFMAMMGLVLLVSGLLIALDRTGGANLSPLFGAGLLGIGSVLVLRFGSARSIGLKEIGVPRRFGLILPCVALVLALFWAAALYAHDLGQRAALAVDSGSVSLPLVTIFSDRFLDLPGSSVRGNQVAGPGERAYFRYTGLSLLTYSNNRWFLISGRYSDAYRSSVVVLQDSDGIRIEVAALR